MTELVKVSTKFCIHQYSHTVENKSNAGFKLFSVFAIVRVNEVAIYAIQ